MTLSQFFVTLTLTAASISALQIPYQTRYTSNPNHTVAEHFISQANNLNAKVQRMQAVRRKGANLTSTGTLNRKRRSFDLGLGLPDEVDLTKRNLVERSELSLGDDVADVYYYGTITVGTPPVDFTTILDTGSSDFILASAPCTGPNCNGTPLYDPVKSTTSHIVPLIEGTDVETPFEIAYGSGAARGILRTETVTFGGFTILNQVFGSVTDIETIFVRELSGLLGLGWATLSETGSVPFVQALWQANRLAKPLFAFSIARWSTTPGSAAISEPGGKMDLGETDPTLYQGSINQIPMSDFNGYWPIPLQDITINGKASGISHPAVLIDSGTSLIGVPPAMAKAIYAAIPGSAFYKNGRYTFPCSTPVSLSFTFGGIAYPMVPSDFNNGRLSGNTCVGSVFALTEDDWIFGDSFLKNVYTVYSFSPPYVGFGVLSGISVIGGPVPKNTVKPTVVQAAVNMAIHGTVDVIAVVESVNKAVARVSELSVPK